jgi:hypothetical protein
MAYANPEDQVVDDAAVKAFVQAYGDRATRLAPVAIVIAAYNEEGAIGAVIEELPGEVCGLATVTIVVADGCGDGTVAEARTAGRDGQPRPRGRAAARLPAGPRGRRRVHRDHRR